MSDQKQDDAQATADALKKENEQKDFYAEDATKKAAEDKAAADAKAAADQKAIDDTKAADEKAAADKKAADEKAAADAKGKPPEKYELKLKENSALPATRLEKIASFAKEQGFSQELATKLVEQEEAAVADYVTQGMKLHDDLVMTVWPKEIAEDKEFGGDKLKENAEGVKRLMAKFGDDEFRNLLDPKDEKNPIGTGYGNNPAFFRFCARLYKSMAPDKLVLGGDKVGEQKSAADIMYGPDTVVK